MNSTKFLEIESVRYSGTGKVSSLRTFVVSLIIFSMLAMGSSLTMKQIKAPLTNTKLMILALVINFVIAPVLGVALTKVFQMGTGLATGLILVSVVAGAPFLPKLAQNAKGDIAFSVGLMVLLMVASILFVVVLFVVAFFMGGSDNSIRSVMGLGAGQRNIGASLAIAGANFASDPNVMVMIIVVAVIALILLMLAGGELGKH